MIRPRQIVSACNLTALISGAALPLAYSPYDFYPLAIIAPSCLVYLWLRATPSKAFVFGYLFGLGMFGVGVGWLHISINLFGGVNLAGAYILTLVFVAFIALFPALAGYLGARLRHHDYPRFSALLLIPAVWTLLEWIRSWFFTGFPWLNLGYSQIDSLLQGLAPVTGVFGISFAMMLTAGALAILIRSNWTDRIIVSALTILLWTVCAIFARQEWTTPLPESITVALVQGSVAQELKWTPEMRKPTMDRYLELTKPYLGRDLIIWPEAAIPAFYDQIPEYINTLLALTAQSHSSLVLGLPYRDMNIEKYYNSVILLGENTSFYFKRHLVPFGEYLPLNSLLREVVDFLHIPMSDFSSGEDLPPLMHAGKFTIGISICYEDTFGEEVIDALPLADILVNISNDAWFGDSAAPHQHLQMARMRALESGRYLLRATNTGITAIINEKGKVIDALPQFTSTALSGVARLYTGMTPYARMGNYPVLLLVVLVVAAATGLKWRI